MTDATVDETAKEAIVAIWTDDGKAVLLKDSMTEGQLADYRRHKEAYFGSIKYVPKGIKTPYDLFLFFMRGQEGIKREKLLEHLKMTEEEVADKSDEDLLILYSEGLVANSGMFKVVDGVLTSKSEKK